MTETGFDGRTSNEACGRSIEVNSRVNSRVNSGHSKVLNSVKQVLNSGNLINNSVEQVLNPVKRPCKP